jgi:PAS domain S-box-containing protein
MGLTPATGSDPAANLLASTTAEMLAALPEGLMVPEGASAAERRLTDVLALYRAVFLHSTEPIAIIDSTGHYLEHNIAHELLLGYTSQELSGKTPAIHMGEDAFADIALELARSGAARREVLSRTKDGLKRVIDLSAFAVRDRAGRPVCYVGIKRDVTEQRRSEEELKRRFEELQVVYRMAEALGRALALDEIYDQAIDGLLDATHAHRASLLLFDADGVMRFKSWRGLSDGYRAAVEGHSPWKQDTRDAQPVTVPDVETDPRLGALLPVLSDEGIRALAFVPLVDDAGTLLGKFMLYFDTPHEWTEGELKLAKTIARHVSFAIARHARETELREANRAKSVFLATMSHELRTPLNAIAGYTDLLDAGIHGDMPPSQREAVQRIQANQRHLLRLIDDVLDFAKLEAGHLQVEIADVPVQETLDGTRVLVEPQFRTKDLRCVYESGDPRITCRGDRAKMQQVLANLLSNAWKFTPSGGTVAVSWEATDEDVRVHVRDTGPGIPGADLETIFAPFVQLQTGFRRKVEGTGLGLAISRELARGMGGDVVASSVLGHGSTFTLTLPRKSPTA